MRPDSRSISGSVRNTRQHGFRFVLPVIAAMIAGGAFLLPACDGGDGDSGKKPEKASKTSKVAVPDGEAEAAGKNAKKPGKASNAEDGAKSGNETGKAGKASATGRAEFEKGIAAYEKKEYEDALIAFKKSAEKGCTDAAVMIGLCYKKGRGLKRDSTKAKIVLEEAAESGNPSAQVICALELLQYDPRDKEGIKLIRRAAEQKCAFAQVLLGMYYNASGNIDKGVAYLKRAANQSPTDRKTPLDFADNDNLELGLELGPNAPHANVCIVYAQSMLGAIYAKGWIVKKDLPEARKWLNKARESGLPESELEDFLDDDGLDLYDIFDTAGEDDD